MLSESNIVNDETHQDHPDEMTEAEYQIAFIKIKQDYFSDKIPQQIPSLFYVTGLPGAGKSSFVEVAKKQSSMLEKSVHINFDDLRIYHPRYQDHIIHDPLNAAARTDVAVERLIGFLVEESTRNKFNVLLDDAAMGQEVTEIVLSPFRQNGYHVNATVVALPVTIARQSVQLRFEENYAAARAGQAVIPRWVNNAEQDNAPTAFIETIETLEEGDLANTLQIIDRYQNVLYSDKQHSGSASTVAKSILTRILTDIEQTTFKNNKTRIETLMHRRLQSRPIQNELKDRIVSNSLVPGLFGLKNRSGDPMEFSVGRHVCGI